MRWEKYRTNVRSVLSAEVVRRVVPSGDLCGGCVLAWVLGSGDGGRKGEPLGVFKVI